MLRIGVPAGLQSMVFSLANICIQSAVNSLGADVMAGSSAAFNIEIFSYYIVISFGQACVTFIGQNHGAGKSDRCKRVVKLCLLQDLIAVAFVAVLIYAFGRQMLSVFNADPAVLEFGMIRLRYIVGAHLFSCVVEVVSGAMRGYGYSAWPALMTLFGVCGIRVLWVYTIFRSSPSLPRLMIVFPVSLSITALAVLSAYFFLTRTRLRDFFAAA
jgi:Na+-driven multidrug efflux pump